MPATAAQGRLLLASALLLAAMLALGVTVARMPSAYAVLEGDRIAAELSPRSWVVPLLVAAACGLGGLTALVAGLRAAVRGSRGSVGGPS